MMTGMLLKFSSLEEHGELDNEQYGKLIRAALKYARDGTEPVLEYPERYLWPGLKNEIILDQERYKAKCLQNAENINKRWEQYRQHQEEVQEAEADTTVYDRIRPDTNRYEAIRTDTNDTNINIKINHQDQDQDQYHHQSQDQSQAVGVLLASGYTHDEISRALNRATGKAIRNPEAYIRQSIENERRQAKTGKLVSAQNYGQRDYSGMHDELMAQQDKEMQEYMDREAEGGNQP